MVLKTVVIMNYCYRARMAPDCGGGGGGGGGGGDDDVPYSTGLVA
jgi:hypothetical protein